MFITTLSYSKFEIIQVQREKSAAKSDLCRKMLLILQVVKGIGTTDCLHFTFSIKLMRTKWN